MENRENPLFGRKIYFLNPTMAVETYVVEQMRDMEYEVYAITNYKHAKPILRQSPDAICFINVDDQLSLKGWYNFIKSFKYDDTLKSIFIGVISSFASTSEKMKFLMDLNLPGGFISGTQILDKMLEQFIAIADLNGAKGRRQYVRFNTDERTDINAYMANGSTLIDIKINNISSVGLACTYSANQVGLFQKNTVINNLCITLGRKSVVCHSLVYNTSITNEAATSVLLFTKETDKTTRQIIKSYIFDCMEHDFVVELSGVIQDLTDYNKDVIYEEEEAELANLNSIGEVGELEELQDEPEALNNEL